MLVIISFDVQSSYNEFKFEECSSVVIFSLQNLAHYFHETPAPGTGTVPSCATAAPGRR